MELSDEVICAVSETIVEGESRIAILSVYPDMPSAKKFMNEMSRERADTYEWYNDHLRTRGDQLKKGFYYTEIKIENLPLYVVINTLLNSTNALNLQQSMSAVMHRVSLGLFTKP